MNVLRVFLLLPPLILAALCCPPPDLPSGGSYVPVKGKYLPGDKVLYSCKEKLTRTGRENRFCLIDGRWTGSTPFCDSPANLKNVHSTSDPRKEVSNVLDGNTSTCFTSRDATAQSLSVFFDEPRPIHFMRLFLREGHTKLVIKATSKGVSKKCADLDRSVGRSQWIALDCEERNSVDSLLLTETSDKANPLTICEIEIYFKEDVWCKDPPDIFVPNGRLEVSRDKATLRCADGFKEGENTRFICIKNNSWSGSLPYLQCDEILCESQVGNETFSGGSWHLETKRPTVGSRKSLQCHHEEFDITGRPTTVTCRKDGTWTPTTAVCVRNVDDKGNLKIIAISVGAVVVLVIFFCLGLTLYCVHKQKGKQVVVMYSPGEDSVNQGSCDAVYSTAYYETPPAPPSPRHFTKGTLGFSTLKSSTLYGIR